MERTCIENRMEESRFQYQVLFKWLTSSKRPWSRPLRDKDQFIAILEATEIDPKVFDLVFWLAPVKLCNPWQQCSIPIGTKNLQATRREKIEVKQQETKSWQNQPNPLPTLPCSQCYWLFYERIGLKIHQQYHHKGSVQHRRKEILRYEIKSPPLPMNRLLQLFLYILKNYHHWFMLTFIA